MRRYVRLVIEAVGLRGDCFVVQIEPPAEV
jgi:hypothetical protein